MRSQTGGLLSMGKGAVYNTSTKQKINTKSSTEAEFFGVDDLMPQILWTRLFLTAQGMNVRDNIIYQDNESAMKLAQNGRASSGKRTRHINIRYYFITDRIANGDVHMEHCPIDRLLADFYTKPLQGKLFRLFRSLILNLDDKVALSMSKKETTMTQNPVPTSNTTKKQQECVGKNVRTDLLKSSSYVPTYADILKKVPTNDTRTTIAGRHPGLLVKLRSAAKQCLAAKSQTSHNS